MNDKELTEHILSAYPNVETNVAMGYRFFYVGADRKMPFATIATQDIEGDSMSNLSRPSVYRLNIGVSKETYRSMFGPQPREIGKSGVVETGHDFTKLDEIMPHPHYAPQSWVCVLNPWDASSPKVRALLDEAHEIAAKRDRRRSGEL